jgi:hypothetical protein
MQKGVIVDLLDEDISVPQLVFLPRAVIAGNAAIFSPR